jgi:outer membrane protein assembly factor BamA
MGTVDLFEDYKVSGGLRIAPNLRDNDVLFEFTNLKKRWDWGFTYYRSSQETAIDAGPVGFPGLLATVKQHSNYYLAHVRYPFDRVRSLRLTAGPRFDRSVFPAINPTYLKLPDIKKTYSQVTLEYVYDNTLNPALDIWHGLRWKLYADWFDQLSELQPGQGRTLFNVGFDARHYLPIYRNIIWAVRASGDFSWGSQKVIYYLGGVDGWLKFRENEKFDPSGNTVIGYRYFNPTPAPAPDADYAFQALALNLRGFRQNASNGNNNLVINSEVRMPVFSTFFDRPINNAFVRNFQLVQFFDLGTAWNGAYNLPERPSVQYGTDANGVIVKIRAGGIGPFAGGYGFGARSTLLGYFLRFDVAWQMDGVFKGKPITYFALGLDF